MGAGTADAVWVETFAAGTYDGDEPGEVWTYTAGDLAEIVRNFAQLSSGPEPLHRVPVAVTHDGVEAYGWVTGCRVKGDVLLTRWADVDPGLAEAIKAGRFKKVSAEIKPEFQARDGRTFGQYLHRVAVLGADIPRVKGLADIPAEWFSDPRPGRRVERIFKFAEGATVPEPQEQKTVVAGAFGIPPELVEKLPDELLDEFVLAAAQKAAGVEPPADEPPAPEMAEGDRQAMIDELVNTFGMDPAEVEAMTDDELAALLEQKRAEGGEEMSEPTTPAPAPAAPKKVTYQFSEADFRREVRKALEAEARPLRREVRALTVAQRRNAAAAKEQHVRAFCEQMHREGRLSAADLDESDPKSLSVVQELMLLDDTQPVRTFSEGGRKVTLTALEMRKNAIRGQAPRRFAERVAVGAGGKPGDDPELAALRQKTRERYDRELGRGKN